MYLPQNNQWFVVILRKCTPICISDIHKYISLRRYHIITCSESLGQKLWNVTANFAANVTPGRNVLFTQAVEASCIDLGRRKEMCRDIRLQVLFSGGKLARRPSAVCSELTICRPDCTFTVNAQNFGLDLCSLSGMNTTEVAAAAADTTLPTGACFKNTDCTGTCSFASLMGRICTCDPIGGFDR